MESLAQRTLARPNSTLHGSRSIFKTAIPKCSTKKLVKYRAQAAEDGFDVSGSVVQPSFRSSPLDLEESMVDSDKVRILFVGECNVCRSVLAEAFMKQLIEECGLTEFVECESKGTRDYNDGDLVDSTVGEVAKDMFVVLPEGFRARQMNEERDIVEFDLHLVMDKFTAADVLREVSVFDTILKGKGYSRKVRRLGEFHPQLKQVTDPDGQDIDDPLYGNPGSDKEMEAVRKVATVIQSACLGLIQFLQEVQGEAKNDPKAFKAILRSRIQSMEGIDWLVPPMLQSQ
ncbi:hypothetical protein BSKO_11309 [Bryopsis sp. KO-2023]|nr:hypothetical protein BSKO_11309 [Bryopsis sp. KO-2023]